MKTYLIEDKKYYKANLHTHTTNSDGKMSPEEVKAWYKKLGYDIVAFTDHTYIEDYNARLSDENFIAINGYENAVLSVKCPDDYKIYESPEYHFCFFIKDKNNLKMEGINALDFERWQKKKNLPNRKDMLFDGKLLHTKYKPSSINKMIKKANERGYLVQYNHPAWSLHSYNDYIRLKGLWGVEVYNNSSCVNGINDCSDRQLEDLSRLGECVCAIASDDSHSWQRIGGGFTYIGAKELTYDAVIDAMVKKDIYASTGPTFEYIYVEDGKAFVKASEVASIRMIVDKRCCKSTSFDIDEENMVIDKTRTGNEGVFDIYENAEYIRFELTDINGNKAWTRAYYKNEWQK